MQQAIDYESRRQVELLETGASIDQETRLFDASTGQTRSMRSKEEAHDYRYFPDPDLLPLEFSQNYVDEIKAELPELPIIREIVLSRNLGFLQRMRIRWLKKKLPRNFTKNYPTEGIKS